LTLYQHTSIIVCMTRKYLSDLSETLVKIKDAEQMQDFLQGILTVQELVEIPQRLIIVKMLKANIPQHEIAKKLGVGVATVTRGSKELQKGRFKNVQGWQNLSNLRG